MCLSPCLEIVEKPGQTQVGPGGTSGCSARPNFVLLCCRPGWVPACVQAGKFVESAGGGGALADGGEGVPPGCGYGMMQWAWPGEALRVDEHGQWQAVGGSVLEVLAERQVE